MFILVNGVELYYFLVTRLNLDDFPCRFERLPLEEQLEIAQQVGTTRAQILSNMNDLSMGTSFL